MAKQKKYHGVVIPMITPFTANGDIDTDPAKKIANHIRSSGACVFVLGTTGESVSISLSLKYKLVETVVKDKSHQTLTYAGIMANCMAKSVEMAEHYFELGVDVVVACVPNYYPLANGDILNYFEALADRTGGPLMLYNIPVTTGLSIPLDIIDRLSQHPKIIGLKDSAKDTERLKQAVEMWKDREDFTYFNGCTEFSTSALALGADGIVPGIGNIVPDLYVKLYNAVLSGNIEKADLYQNRSNKIADIFQKNKNLSESLSTLKAVMHILGFCSPKMLPPLRELNLHQIQKLREAVNNIHLLDENQTQ